MENVISKIPAPSEPVSIRLRVSIDTSSDKLGGVQKYLSWITEDRLGEVSIDKILYLTPMPPKET